MDTTTFYLKKWTKPLDVRSGTMSESMLKMYISFAGMIFLFISIGLILLSRYKLKGIFAVVVAIFAYLFLIVGGLIIFYIVISGPTS
ncbi:DUF2768 domain-containing protein [Terrihalobacillus insolitus]